MITSEPIVLHDDLLLIKGTTRSIFRHPDSSEWLIKLYLPEYIERKYGTKAPWYKRKRRLGYFVGLAREWQEQLAVYLHYGSHPSCMQFIVALQPTEYGLGQIVQAVRGKDGNYAPTLKTLLVQGRFDDQAERALQHFFDWLLAAPLVISDLTTDNLVYRCDPVLGEHFCIIDGVGDSNLIPLKSFFQWWNRRSKQRWIAKLTKRISSFVPT